MGECPSRGLTSVQEVVHTALLRTFRACAELQSAIQGAPSGLVSCSRTDRGVHARHLVAYCNCKLAGCADEESLLELARLLLQELRQQLPSDVACSSSQWTRDLSFFPKQYSSKSYVYYVADAPTEQDSCDDVCARDLGCLTQGIWVCSGNMPLLIEPMKEALSLLRGHNNFSAFTSGVDKECTERFLLDAKLEVVEHEYFDILEHCFLSGRVVATNACWVCNGRSEHGSAGRVRLVRIQLSCAGFLRNMVRHIVGYVTAIGHKEATPEVIVKLLGTSESLGVLVDWSGGMSWRVPKAPSRGLWLHSVDLNNGSDRTVSGIVSDEPHP